MGRKKSARQDDVKDFVQSRRTLFKQAQSDNAVPAFFAKVYEEFDNLFPLPDELDAKERKKIEDKPWLGTREARLKSRHDVSQFSSINRCTLTI